MKTLTKNISYAVTIFLILDQIYSQNLRKIFTCPSPSNANSAILKTAALYAILAGTTVTVTGTTTILGNIGVSPGTAITGTATMTCGSELTAPNLAVAQAQVDLQAAYNYLVGLPAGTNPGATLSGITLTPGTYTFAGALSITSLILDAGLNANAVWTFQIIAGLNTVANSSVTVINGGSNFNVYWQVGSSVVFGSNTHFIGNIIANTAITMGNSATFTGRALAINAAVTMDTNTGTSVSCGGS